MTQSHTSSNDGKVARHASTAGFAWAPWGWTVLIAAMVIAVFGLRFWQVQDASAAASGPKLNDQPAPKPTPEGMVWVPGGSYWMGDNEFPDAMPEHLVTVDGFWMDKHEVTNAEFAKFVEATGYETIAEQPLDPAEFPTVPLKDLKPGSIVFDPPPGPVPLDNHLQWWAYVPGANWRHPEGPDSTIEGRENHPVVHIAWNDATAYAKWAGKRLAQRSRVGTGRAGRTRSGPLLLGQHAA